MKIKLIGRIGEYMNRSWWQRNRAVTKHGKLGKRAPVVDRRTLQLAKYSASLPAPPPSADFTKGVTSWGMMLNGPNSYGDGVPGDGLGDCTCAMAGHGVQVARLNSPSGIVTPPDLAILNLYIHACYYQLGNEATDQGGYIVNVLNWARQWVPWHHKGPMGAHKFPYQLLAYADPLPGDINHIKQAIATFGTVAIGLQLPITAQAQTGGVWDVVGNPQTDPNSQPGSWGGHAVIVPKYDGETLTCITWGGLQKMTWNFWKTYVDEAHALLYRAWVEQYGTQYQEMLNALMADLKLVTN